MLLIRNYVIVTLCDNMQSKATRTQDYLAEVPVDRINYFKKLRETISRNLPKGFVEEMNFGMIGYVVPHDLYPAGYRCDPEVPLPFVNIVSHKNFIGFYHVGIYANQKLSEWFVKEYIKQCDRKPDMGKSCIRFKKMDQIPFPLIGELMRKMSVKDWVKLYEENIKR